MNRIPPAQHTRRRVIGKRLLTALVAAGVGAACLTACGSSASAPPPVPIGNRPPVPTAPPIPMPDPDPGGLFKISMVDGHVTDRDTGAPLTGFWVEFKPVYGNPVHTETDSSGYYSAGLPEGVYTALAGSDDPEHYYSLEVTGREDNAVTVPPSTTIDFVGHPL